MKLSLSEIAQIQVNIPDFIKKTHFDVWELFDYDNKINEKLKDENSYQKIADINVYTAVSYYGGANVEIYKSTKENGHYVYRKYTWGD